MSDDAQQSTTVQAESHEHAEKIGVKVLFPISQEPTFHHNYEPQTLIGTVRTAAMEHYKVVDDAQYRYYLSQGGRLDNDHTLASVAKHEHELKLKLVKELIQG